MQLEAKTREKIERGDVVTSLTDVQGHKRAQAIALVDAPIEKVWDAITDYNGYKDFMPHTRESEVLEEKKNVVRFRTVLQFPIRDVWYIIRLTLNRKDHHVDWILEDGNIKSNEGSWDLKKFDGRRTLATYTVAIDPGFFVPKFLLHKATEGSLPMLIRAVRDRVTK